MSTTKRKLALQLLKEFWIPFSASAAWTGYVVWGKPITLENILAAFGPAFFLASWVIGQFFRVRKQAGVESSLGNVETRLTNLVEQMETHTKDMVSHITGGSSYCYLFPAQDQQGQLMWVVHHQGDYPLYQVQARIVDLTLMDQLSKEGRFDDAKSATTYNFGDMPCGTIFHRAGGPLGDGDARDFNCFIYARNGRIAQEVRWRRVDGRWSVAYRVRREYETLIQVLPKGFPLDPEEQAEWGEPGISGSDGSSSLEYQLQSLLH